MAVEGVGEEVQEDGDVGAEGGAGFELEGAGLYDEPVGGGVLHDGFADGQSVVAAGDGTGAGGGQGIGKGFDDAALAVAAGDGEGAAGVAAPAEFDFGVGGNAAVAQGG